MSDKCKSQVEKEIMTAIDLCGSEGASLDDIQQHLKCTLKNNVPDLECIQSVLNKAVAKELLLELDNGKYKIKGPAKQADATSEGTIMADKVLSSLHCEDNEIKATTRCAKENAKEVECFDGKVAQDANRNIDSDTKSIGTSMTEKYTKVSLPDDNDRVLSKLNKLHLNDNETKATGRRAEENAQEVNRPLDKCTQDAHRNADSVTGNVGSSLTKEDAKASLPDDCDEVASKLNDLHHKDNETKATGRRAEENAQDVKCSVDKVTQDANRNAGSDKRKIAFSVTEKDANIPLPDDDDKIDKEKLIKCLKKEK